jgi:hypothetical protein
MGAAHDFKKRCRQRAFAPTKTMMAISPDREIEH